MSRIHESIEVNVPVTTAYNQWTQFEDFPEFMEGVEQVQQLDDTTLQWTAKIAGKTKQWQAKIVDQTPDRRVAWESIDGAPNDGAVTFESLGADRSRIDLDLEVEPEGMVESAGDALGFVQRRAKGDLERFKEFIESRGSETGAWRGEVRGGQETTAASRSGGVGVSTGAMGTGAGTIGSGDDLGASGAGSAYDTDSDLRSTGSRMGSTGSGDWTTSGQTGDTTYDDTSGDASSTGHGTIGSAGSTGYGGAGIADETDSDRSR
jgi:hypothetical protein